jgi:hypothetical protein
LVTPGVGGFDPSPPPLPPPPGVREGRIFKLNSDQGLHPLPTVWARAEHPYPSGLFFPLYK